MIRTAIGTNTNEAVRQERRASCPEPKPLDRVGDDDAGLDHRELVDRP